MDFATQGLLLPHCVERNCGIRFNCGIRVEVETGRDFFYPWRSFDMTAFRCAPIPQLEVLKRTSLVH